MWWTYQVLGCLVVTAIVTFISKKGLTVTTWGTYVLAQVWVAWAFHMSYKLAPTFFQAWFVGNATLALGGFAISCYCREAIHLYNYAGAAMVFMGAVLLIIK